MNSHMKMMMMSFISLGLGCEAWKNIRKTRMINFYKERLYYMVIIQMRQSRQFGEVGATSPV